MPEEATACRSFRRESRELSGRLPEYALAGDTELRLMIWAAQP